MLRDRAPRCAWYRPPSLLRERTTDHRRRRATPRPGSGCELAGAMRTTKNTHNAATDGTCLCDRRGLSSNALSGSIPATWGTSGGLQSLVTLYLMYNKLSGFVPGSLTLLPRLSQLCAPPSGRFAGLTHAQC